MTFTEAALAVMEREGRPMHSREIASMAVEQGILSHVGKTPVQTMSARLSAAVAKGKGNSPFIRIRPGVFALAAWNGNPPGKKPEEKAAAEPNRPSSSASRPKVAREKQARSDRPRAAETKPRAAETKPRAAETKPRAAETKHRAAETKPRAAETKSQATEANPRNEDVRPPSQTKQPPAEKPRENRKPSDTRAQETRARDIEEESLEAGQAKKKKRRRRKRRSDENDVASKPPAPVVNGKSDKLTETSHDDRDDGGIVDRIESVIRRATRPVPVSDLAKSLGRSDDSAVTLLHALLIADGLTRESDGLRPRFVEHRGGYALSEREVSSEIIGLEKQISDAKERLTRLAERQILRKLRNVSMRSFVRIMIVHLQRLGFEEMVPVNRNGRDEFHLSMQDRRHGGRFRTAVVLRRDPVDPPLLDRAVVDMRGALHHYNSTSGMIITTGSIGDRARTEATVANLSPVTLVDGEMLATEMVKLGVGTRTRTIDLPVFDEAFFSVFEA